MSSQEGFRPEIERKYLLAALPEAVRGHRSLEIEQGYLEGGVRLRRVRSGEDERFVRTEKRGKGLVRSERETEIDARRFAELWPATAGRRLRKRRWLVPVGPHTFEVDEFLDRPLVLAEVELAREDECVELPAWLAPHVVREVTLEPAYTNASLAR